MRDRYFLVSYPANMFGDFVIWFINQHEGFYKPRGELIFAYEEADNKCKHPYPCFSIRPEGSLGRDGFPSFQGKSSDNATIVLIDQYTQNRKVGFGEKNPIRKKLNDIYEQGILGEKLDELCKELGMDYKIAFKNLWVISSMSDQDLLGHFSLPHEDFSTVFITIDESSVWYDIVCERNKLQDWEGMDVVKNFPSSECTLQVDRLLDKKKDEYDNLLSFIKEPPLENWKELISIYGSHINEG